jgi:hypothetical protein
MEGFGSFGGGGTTVSEPEQVQPVDDAAQAFGSAFGQMEASSGESYEVFAERMRGELGPTDVRSLEEYLNAPASPAAEPTMEMGGMEASPAFGGMGAPPEEASPISTEESAPSTMEEPTSAAAEDPFAAFNTGADAGEAVETPGEQTATPDDPVSVGPTLDPFAAFAGPATEEPPSAPSTSDIPVIQIPTFTPPDFSGMGDVVEEEPPARAKAPAPEPASEFSGPSFDAPPATENKIEAFAEKLQDAGKITPVIDFSSKTSSDSTGEAAVNAGFVTPTLAEIYAKQGWYDDAINAYKTLAKTRPADKERFEQRVKELEEEKKKAE